ncbi:putative Mg2+ transporter protein, CorA-like/Zinc transport protein ZntB [Helianthus annuus]|uniref:Magnesium transporter n=1 Tax=Helianthus annuus TaxID=4232 RepID=A0A251TG86_HELAN|nr:magnesium transporter MRS2-I [Helianthus annuus]KAF5784978.1 putative Mg2+ transporter protein, CorA-like/Zinc transport protein ZntB [Helianthus annuus]KAJ0512598.1 putative Mg2+ transporter protein, CorA-like/Zinc transport protein ZntB [Helianthus annuus]KAJ0528723.1 putative Mg2+ transporter protein, CorA-like/Zinc transport protein ZntB [Helianthus annuus]KAJ0695633.1 putative Mg2+ transporter protein, CorA-like/Zinc transport protein ZntB [Helianthus annuus]
MASEGLVVPVDSFSQPASLIKKTAVSRSWVSVDSSGQSTVLDLDKYGIMKRVSIHARDLRLLDPLLSYPSAILGREKAIVLNLEHIKAIITTEEVLLRDPMDDNVIPIVEELQRRLPPVNGNYLGQGDDEEGTGVQTEAQTSESIEFPFEFRALEVALEGICSFLDARTRELETDAYPALDELTSMISSRNLDRVRKLKSAMTRLTNRVLKVRDELEQLLDDDDDMADLYLSRKLSFASSPSNDGGDFTWSPASPTIESKISRASRTTPFSIHGEHDVEELEMLLEAYFMQIEATSNKLTTLREYIDDTEDYINIQLDNHRNQLIQLELFLLSGTVSLSVYSLVAAIFGMNIPYPWNKNHGYMFKWVIMFAAMVSASVFISITTYSRHKGLVGS